MNILFLGYEKSPLIDFLRDKGHDVHQTEDKISGGLSIVNWADFVISYGYLHIIKKDIIDKFPDKIINLHISYLPWNKGKDPNFWSWVEDTSKGVTIHYIDEGIDTGDILTQKKVEFFGFETLRTSYMRLRYELDILFIKSWDFILSGALKPRKQIGQGSYHKGKDKESLLHLLTEGYDTPVKELCELYE